MLLKKAGMVVLAAGAGMVALTPAAFAGDAPQGFTSENGGHNWDGDHHGDKDRDHGHRGHHGHWGHHGSSDRDASSTCGNDVNQLNASKSSGLINALNGSQIAAPINACSILDNNDILKNVGIDIL